MYITPSPLAWIALLSWPFVVFYLYGRLGAGRALIWSVMGGYMFLPERLMIDLPLLPDIDKHILPVLSAAIISGMKLKEGLPVFRGGMVTRLLICAFILSPVATVLGNPDMLVFGNGTIVPGLRLYDSLSMLALQAMLILPMFLARRDLAQAEAIRDLLLALLAGGLLYAPLILIEARLSPQLHTWIYGYFQHDFIQAMRFGGFRPFVFMPHGLWVAFFMLCAFLACAALIRAGEPEKRGRYIMLFPVMAVLLILCKSFGPVGYALAALPLLLFAPPRVMLIVSSVLAAIVVFYPLLRGSQLVPVLAVLELAEALNADRAQSFGFRLMNEEALLDRAALRPWFGWGGYGRGFVMDPATGEHISVADGTWIIHIGAFGWLGFIAQFGLLALPICLMTREAATVSRAAASLTLIYALNLVDLLPNATLTPLSWMICGALLGYAEQLRHARLFPAEAKVSAVSEKAEPIPPRRIVIGG